MAQKNIGGSFSKASLNWIDSWEDSTSIVGSRLCSWRSVWMRFKRDELDAFPRFCIQAMSASTRLFGSVEYSPSLPPSLSLSLCVSLCVCFSLSLSLSFFSLFLSFFPSLPPSLSLFSLSFPPSLPPCLSVRLSVFSSLSLSLYIYILLQLFTL